MSRLIALLDHWAQALGHLAVPVGLYLAACAACAVTGLGLLDVAPVAAAWAIAGAFLTGQSMYLLDRVKLRDAWLDPADEAAQPERFAFLARSSGWVRLLAAADAAGALVIAWVIHPLLPIAVAGLLASIVVYAGLPRDMLSRTVGAQRRLKDVLGIKNLAVAAGITAYSLAIVWALIEAAGASMPALAAWIWVGLFLGLHVLADAMLCDIDDAPSDQRFGTRTLAWRFGEKPTRRLALALAAAATIFTGVQSGIDPTPLDSIHWFWAIAMLASSCLLIWNRAGPMRTAVDLRLPIVAILAIAFDLVMRRWT